MHIHYYPTCWNIGIDTDEDGELIDTTSKEEHSIYRTGLRGSPGGKDGRLSPEPAGESRAAVISGRVGSGSSSPDAHYSDTSPGTEGAMDRGREGENETASIATNGSRGEKYSETRYPRMPR